MTRDMEILWER